MPQMYIGIKGTRRRSPGMAPRVQDKQYTARTTNPVANSVCRNHQLRGLARISEPTVLLASAIERPTFVVALYE
jgi:hypothetical protein